MVLIHGQQRPTNDHPFEMKSENDISNNENFGNYHQEEILENKSHALENNHFQPEIDLKEEDTEIDLKDEEEFENNENFINDTKCNVCGEAFIDFQHHIQCYEDIMKDCDSSEKLKPLKGMLLIFYTKKFLKNVSNDF